LRDQERSNEAAHELHASGHQRYFQTFLLIFFI
jgi:hypothetical protein